MEKGWGEGTLSLEELGRSLGHHFCWGCISSGWLGFGAWSVVLVNVAVYALSSVGKSMSYLLCLVPGPQSDPKKFTLRA